MTREEKILEAQRRRAERAKAQELEELQKEREKLVKKVEKLNFTMDDLVKLEGLMSLARDLSRKYDCSMSTVIKFLKLLKTYD